MANELPRANPMSWKQIRVGDATDVARLQNALIERFIEAGNPTDAVMCINKKPVRNGYHLFFSPAAASLANDILARYSSTDCVTPDPGDVIVLRHRWTTLEPGDADCNIG